MALRERQDRIIPLKDAAKAVNMTLTMFDGIKDEDITKEHIPKVFEQPHRRRTYIANK